MYQITQDFCTALERGPVLLRVLAAGETLEPVNVSYTAACGGGETLGIGEVCAACVRIKLPGSLELQDAPITVEAGAELDGQTAYLPLGRFVVAQQDRGEDTTTITAYDAAYYALGASYVPNDQTPPATAFAVLADICAQRGLSLGSTAGLTDQPVTGDLTGHTCREMAGFMAALLGCNALIGRGGSLELRWFAASGLTVTADEYYSGALSLAGTSTLAGVRMTKKVTAQDGTEETVHYDAGIASGSGAMIAVENPYATQAIVDDVWARIGGLGSYRTGRCALFGGLLIEPGDVVTITDRAGVSATVPVMSVTLELDGGCKCTLESAGKSDTAAAANVQGPTSQALSRLAADVGLFREVTAEQFTATGARIDNLWANTAFIESLLAQNITATGTISGANLVGASIQSEADGTGGAAYSRTTIDGGQIISEGTGNRRLYIDGGYLGVQEGENEILLDPDTEDYGYGLVIFSAGRQMPSYYTNEGCYVQGDISTLGTLTTGGQIRAGAAIYTDRGVVAGNNDGFNCKNASGTNAKIAFINTNNEVILGNSGYVVRLNGSGITLGSGTSIKGAVTAEGSIGTDRGVVSANNYGYYCKNAAGDQVKLVFLNTGNLFAVGNASYDTNLKGKTITSDKTITVSSDQRLKHGITVTGERHERLFDALRPVAYRLNGDAEDREHIGFVAQQVRSALEEAGLTDSALVQEDAQGMLSIGYTELIGLLVSQVQTLKARVDCLERSIRS